MPTVISIIFPIIFPIVFSIVFPVVFPIIFPVVIPIVIPVVGPTPFIAVATVTTQRRVPLRRINTMAGGARGYGIVFVLML